MNNEHFINSGPQLTSLKTLLTEKTLNPLSGHDNKFKSVVPYHHDNLEYRGHICFSGSFIDEPDAVFTVYVKRASNLDEALTELVQNNINSFEYQMAVGDLLHKQGAA